MPGNAYQATVMGSWRIAAEESFTAAGPTLRLQTASADVTQLNAAGYVEFYVEGSSAGSIVHQSLIDEAPEFIVSGAAAQNVAFSGIALLPEGEIFVWRWYFTGSFGTGEAFFETISGSIADTSGLTNAAVTQTFLVRGSTATLVYPGSTVFGVSALNSTRHIDVRFTPTTGQTLNLESILDNESEILITGTAAGQVVVNGRPTQLDEETFRYTVEGEFTAGSFTISFLDNLMVDSAGAGLTGRSEVITLRNLTAGLSYP
ncbi:MAG: hypothetical protein ACK5YO_07660, partial [Planctomyces sp.]